MTPIRHACATAALALAALPLISAHKGAARDSLSFRPPHPGAYFTTQAPAVPALVDAHPHDVAHAFMRSYMPEHIDNYYIREDSYTDAKSGVSHVYIRQVVNGFEVADGDINLNIHDGKVLSYGNSFFKVPGHIASAPTWHQDTFCDSALSTSDTFTCGASRHRVHGAAYVPTSSLQESGPCSAAFFFMLAANPYHEPMEGTFEAIRAERLSCLSPIGNTHWCEEWLVSGVPSAIDPIKARKVYIQTPSDKSTSATDLNLAWRLEVTLPDNHYEAYVSANDPSKVIAVVDWIADAPTPEDDGWLNALERAVFGQAIVGASEVLEAFVGTLHEDTPRLLSPPASGSYRVWKWGVNDPESGNRTLEVSPHHKAVSPLGWHTMPASVDPIKNHPELGADALVNFTTTIGNNVIVQSNRDTTGSWKTNPRPDGSPELVFDFPYEGNLDPEQHINTSITQLFYMANMYHDLLYFYGFDEASGNFQQYNFGKGGQQGDGIIIHAQDSSTRNDATFETPADGKSGICRMHIWDRSTPFRDGGLDAGILIHELTHGLSSRLTGGPKNSFCLKGAEAGGLGEGWSDYIATSVRSTSTYQDYVMGAWASDKPTGSRSYPYSTNITVNPRLYGHHNVYDVHVIGEVWAEILWVVANKLIEKYGFASSLFPSAVPDFYGPHIDNDSASTLAPKHGNTLMLQLLVFGMKLQPCWPSFLAARDAIIAADNMLTGGVNRCLLWKAFASRGLGTDAKKLGFDIDPSINGFEVPPDCKPL